MQISQIFWVWSKVFSVCSPSHFCSPCIRKWNTLSGKTWNSLCFGRHVANKSKGTLWLLASDQHTGKEPREVTSMCHVFICLSSSTSWSKSFTSCKTSAHVVGLQCPRTESPKQPLGGRTVSTKGMWLSHDFPLESKCYQSSVWALQVRACCGYLSLSND